VKRTENVGGGADSCQVLWRCCRCWSAQPYRYSVRPRNASFWALRRQAANMRLLVRALSVRMEQLGSRRFEETGYLHVFKAHEHDSLSGPFLSAWNNLVPDVSKKPAIFIFMCSRPTNMILCLNHQTPLTQRRVNIPAARASTITDPVARGGEEIINL
jgi:hypothetical protein